LTNIEIGKVKARGGLNEVYQDIIVQVKTGDNMKAGLQMTLRDNITHGIKQRPVQIMFNEEEIRKGKLANLRFLLTKTEQVVTNLQKSNKRLVV